MTKVVLGVASLLVAFSSSISLSLTERNDSLSDNFNYTTAPVQIESNTTSLSDFTSSLNATAETVTESVTTVETTMTTSNNSSEAKTTSSKIENNPSIIPVTNSVQTHSTVSNISHNEGGTTRISSNEISHISVVSVVSNETATTINKSESTTFTPESTTAATFHVPENCSSYKVSLQLQWNVCTMWNSQMGKHLFVIFLAVGRSTNADTICIN